MASDDDSVVHDAARHHSLTWRLPALISVLVVFVLAVFLYSAYREVETTLMRAGGDRARTAANQVAALLERSTQQGTERLRQAAVDPGLHRFLREPTAANRESARAVLAKLAQPPPRRVSLWNSAGVMVLDIDAPATYTPGLPPKGLPVPAQPPAVGFGPLQASDGAFFVDSVAVVSDEGSAAAGSRSPSLGWLGIRSGFSVNPPDALNRLVGQAATIEIGSSTSGVWTDLQHVVPPPQVDLTRDGVSAYRRPDGGTSVGALSAIRATPWAVWVEFPREELVRPARTFLQRMTLIGVIVAFAGALLVRVLTVQITTPLAEMTHAAEAIAAGDYSSRVVSNRDDEIGRLGNAFNAMTARVEEAHHELERRVEARTRELDDALSALSRRSEAREAYLATIVDGSDDAIVGTSLDGTVQSWNAGAERLYGYTAPEVIGRSATVIKGNDQPGELSELLERLKRGEHIRHYETVHARKDGSAVTVALTLSPIRDAEGHIVGASIVARDVSERRALEDQLRQAQKMDAVGQLAGGVAHDFNNLLTAILGYANLLAEGLDETDERRTDVEEIRKAAWRARR